jgi:hypothetical protein
MSRMSGHFNFLSKYIYPPYEIITRKQASSNLAAFVAGIGMKENCNLPVSLTKPSKPGKGESSLRFLLNRPDLDNKARLVIGSSDK